MKRRFLVAAMMLLVSCGHGDDESLALAQQYANEIHDVAIHCDPSAANPCGGQLPVIVYEQAQDGSLKLEGLSSTALMP